jgi:hypothetical protein
MPSVPPNGSKASPVPRDGVPTPVSTVDWITGATTVDVTQMDATQIWRSAVALAATNARKALPECNGRIDKAIALVLSDQVELLDNGHAMVQSHSDKGVTSYHITNGTCDCADFARAPQGQCKHRLARGIALRATQIAKELGQASSPVTLGPEDRALDVDAAPSPPPPAPSMPDKYIVHIHGKPFVKYEGLLAEATQQGLLSLKAEFISVTERPWRSPKPGPSSTMAGCSKRVAMPRPPTSMSRCGSILRAVR